MKGVAVRPTGGYKLQSQRALNLILVNNRSMHWRKQKVSMNTFKGPMRVTRKASYFLDKVGLIINCAKHSKAAQ